MNLPRTLLYGATFCISITTFGKCWVWGASMQLIREADPPVMLATAGFYGLTGNLGTGHLGSDDQLRLELDFECPMELPVMKDGLLFSTWTGGMQFIMDFSEDGQYEIPATADWDGCQFGVDHSTSPLSATVLNVFAFLSGAMQSTTMRDDLRVLGFVPITEPYSAMGMPPTDPSGSVTTTQILAGTDATLSVVDWVLVELRSAADPSVVVSSKCGLLRRSGQLRAANGPIFEVHVPPGDYYVAVRHRNHLGMMTAAPIGLYGITRAVDFRTNMATWGTNAQKTVGTYLAMWPGNASPTTGTQRISYVGANNDRDPMLQRVGGNVPTATVQGYYSEDTNMNGTVKYTGANNDRDIILQSIGGTVPTAVRVEQLPW